MRPAGARVRFRAVTHTNGYGPAVLAAALTALALAQADPHEPGPHYRPQGALPAPTIVDEDACRFAGRAFRITLPSPTGFPEEDDMVLTFEQKGRKAVQARWPGRFPAAWWKLDPRGELPREWEPGPICGVVDAVPAGGARLLLFLRVSGRPQEDQQVGVLYDVARHAVLDLRRLGPEGDFVERGEGVLWFQPAGAREVVRGELIRSVEDRLHLPDGDLLVSVDGDPRPLNPVLAVRVRSGRIVTAVDAGRTITRRGWEKIFPSAEAFRAVFPRDGLYRAAKTKRGRTCVQPARPERVGAWRTAPWACERE